MNNAYVYNESGVYCLEEDFGFVSRFSLSLNVGGRYFITERKYIKPFYGFKVIKGFESTSDIVPIDPTLYHKRFIRTKNNYYSLTGQLGFMALSDRLRINIDLPIFNYIPKKEYFNGNTLIQTKTPR